MRRVPLLVPLVLAHPRIVTLLPNGDEPGGDDDMGAMRVVRVMGGAAVGAAQATVGDIIAARTVDGSTLRVDVLADAPRPLVIDLFVDGAFALVTAAESVTDEDALLACTSSCSLVESGRVRLAGSGRDLALAVELP